MCGQCGVYSMSFGSPEYSVFEKLLHLNVYRGQDSTGVIRVDKKGKIATRKTLLPSPRFLFDKEVSDIVRDTKGMETPMALLGHTRAATKGKVILANAHPFKFPKVVGTHNGTIHKSFKNRDKFDVDSEALYSLINDVGIEEALKEVNDWDTAYALQWVDKTNNTLNFIRNSKRPLHFTYIYNGTTLVWSSEWEVLEFVLKLCKQNNPSGWKGDKKDTTFTLHPNFLLTVPMGKSPSEATMVDLKIPEKKASTTTYTSSGGSGHSTTNASSGGSSQTPSYANGDWVKTDKGYKWVEKSKATSLTTSTGNKPDPFDSGKGASPGSSTKLLTSSSESPKDTNPGKQTTTTTATTSVPSHSSGKRSQSHSTTSTSGRKEGTASTVGDTYGNFRDKYGPEKLRSLPWLYEGPSEGQNDDEGSVGSGETQSTLPPIGLGDGEDGVIDNAGLLKLLKPLDDLPWEEGGNVVPLEHTFKGHKGVALGEREFRYKLSCGCFNCGEVYDLDNPHDFAGINSMRWATRDEWACGECYENEEWVKLCCDGLQEFYVMNKSVG